MHPAPVGGEEISQMDIVSSLSDILGSLLGQMGTAISNAVTQFVPGFIAAALVVIIGWLIASFLAEVLKRAFVMARFEKILQSYHVHDALGDLAISELLTKAVKYYVLLAFVAQAVNFLNLGVITGLVTAFLVYAPLVITAILVFAIAAVIGEYLKERILRIKASSPVVRNMAVGVKLLVVYLGAITALNTAGLDTSFINQFAITVIQALSLGVAAAFAIAFGLGGQAEAKSVIAKVKKAEW